MSMFPAPSSNSFLPEDFIARKAELRANLLTLSLFAVVMAGVVGAFLVTNRQWRALSDEQKEVEAAFEAEAKKIDQLNALEEQRAQVLEKAEVTAALSERVPRWALLADLELRLPPDMYIDQLALKSKRIEAPPPPTTPQSQPLIKTLTGSGDSKPSAPVRPKVQPPKFEYALTLNGLAEKNNDIADFLTAMRGSPVFTRVELQYIREAKEDDAVVRKFEISASLRDDVDIEALANSIRELMQQRVEQAEGGTPADSHADASKEG